MGRRGCPFEEIYLSLPAKGREDRHHGKGEFIFFQVECKATVKAKRVGELKLWDGFESL